MVKLARARKGYDAEAAFALQLKVSKLPTPERQFQPALDYGREWAVDFAWPDYRLIVEIDGAPHRIKERFLEDQRKRLAWEALGWVHYHFSPAMVRSGLALEMARVFLEEYHLEALPQLRSILMKHGILKEGR